MQKFFNIIPSSRFPAVHAPQRVAELTSSNGRPEEIFMTNKLKLAGSIAAFLVIMLASIFVAESKVTHQSNYDRNVQIVNEQLAIRADKAQGRVSQEQPQEKAKKPLKISEVSIW